MKTLEGVDGGGLGEGDGGGDGKKWLPFPYGRRAGFTPGRRVVPAVVALTGGALRETRL